MGISEHREDDEKLLREYCIETLNNPKTAARDKTNAANLLARLQNLLQKESTADIPTGIIIEDDYELSDEEMELIRKAALDGEFQ